MATAKAALTIAESNRLNAYSNWQTTKALFVKIFGITPEDINLPLEVIALSKSLNELSLKSLELNPVIENARHYLAAIKAQEFAAKAFLSSIKKHASQVVQILLVLSVTI